MADKVVMSSGLYNTLPNSDYRIDLGGKIFADVGSGGVRIDWDEAERQSSTNGYAKLIIAIRDGTWTPLRSQAAAEAGEDVYLAPDEDCA